MSSIALGIPVYRDVHYEVALTLAQWARLPVPEGWSTAEIIGRGQPVSWTRERIAREAVFGEPQADILLFMDSDVAPDRAEDLWRLANRLVALPEDVWVLGVGVPIQKTGQSQLNASRITDPLAASPRPLWPVRPEEATAADPLVEVAGIGFGLVAIRRAAFLELERPWFTFGHDPDDAERGIGEDMGFCDLVRAAGGRVLADLSIRCSHYFDTEHVGYAPFAPARGTRPGIRQESHP